MLVEVATKQGQPLCSCLGRPQPYHAGLILCHLASWLRGLQASALTQCPCVIGSLHSNESEEHLAKGLLELKVGQGPPQTLGGDLLTGPALNRKLNSTLISAEGHVVRNAKPKVEMRHQRESWSLYSSYCMKSFGRPWLGLLPIMGGLEHR